MCIQHSRQGTDQKVQLPFLVFPQTRHVTFDFNSPVLIGLMKNGKNSCAGDFTRLIKYGHEKNTLENVNGSVFSKYGLS